MITLADVARLAFVFALGIVFGVPPVVGEPSYVDRLPEDEIIYFVLADRFENGDPENDRGGLQGGRLDHGFDPTHKGFYHGGDLKGLTEQLEYIATLGASAIWLAPIYKNRPVQGRGGEETAGYHGYWVTDFTDVDPHLGTKADLKALVEAAHARGMKVYLDIVTNHTADIIYYEECHGEGAAPELGAPGACPYRSRLTYPFTSGGGVDAIPINEGFLGDGPEVQTEANFGRLQDPSFAYTPRVRPVDQGVKVPAWLNDIRLYNNRGDSFWAGESAIYGDFAGLDDLMTTNPRVLAGFIEIYKAWITEFRIDGFRIDTAKHVNPEFWPPFIAAMKQHAAGLGIPNFHIFGEVYSGDPVELARFTRLHGFPAVLDFAFQEAVVDVLVHGEPPTRLINLFRADALYSDETAGALRLPTFIGNHDAGRFAAFLNAAHPDMPDAERLARLRLAHAIMIFARGIPVIYYGAEQGFIGDGGDQDAREDMFPTHVASYADNDLIGTARTGVDRNFDPTHPLFQAISAFAAVYHRHIALRRGEQVVRMVQGESGLLALSRMGGDDEYLIVFNTTDTVHEVRVQADARSTAWTGLIGTCKPGGHPGHVVVAVPALDFAICHSKPWGVEE